MSNTLSSKTLRRLDVQGFDSVDPAQLASVAPWLRMAFAMCATLAGVGTVLASPVVLAALIPIAVLAAIFPVHPFDLIYNVGVRRFTGTPRLPKRGVPSRVACGLGAVWVATTAWAFSAGYPTIGYVLGGALTATATLVSTTDICIPSLIYRGIFGQPKKR